MNEKDKLFFTNKFKSILPIIPVSAFIFAFTSSGIDLESSINIQKRVFLLGFLLIYIILLVYYFKLISKPRVVISDFEVKVRSLFGRVEIFRTGSFKTNIGKDYIELIDTNTSKVHHLNKGSFNSEVWSRLAEEIKKTEQKSGVKLELP